MKYIESDNSQDRELLKGYLLLTPNHREISYGLSIINVYVNEIYIIIRHARFETR